MPRKILVAVAWPYVNGEPHLGHIAGMNVPADIFARYHRIVGNEVAMVSGSDMHGTPTALKAADEAIACAGLEDGSGFVKPERFGVIFGSGIGGITTLEKQHDILREKGPRFVSPFFIPMFIPDIAAGLISMGENGTIEGSPHVPSENSQVTI